VSFRVKYTMSLDGYRRDIQIAVGLLVALALLYSLVQVCRLNVVIIHKPVVGVDFGISLAFSQTPAYTVRPQIQC